jgi:hypothetical protein
MCDGDETVVRVFDERGRSFHASNSVYEPVQLYLQHPGDFCETVQPWARRASAQYVIDKRPVHTGHFSNMRGAEPELVRASLQAIRKRVVFGHVIPRRMWIR